MDIKSLFNIFITLSIIEINALILLVLFPTTIISIFSDKLSNSPGMRWSAIAFLIILLIVYPVIFISSWDAIQSDDLGSKFIESIGL